MKGTLPAQIAWLCLLAVFWCAIGGRRAVGHDHTMHRFLQARRAASANDPAPPATQNETGQPPETCQLRVNLLDAATDQSLPGLVRVTDVLQGKPLALPDLIQRENRWYAMPKRATVTLPQSKLRIEAIHGLETELLTKEIDLTGQLEAAVELPLQRFYNAAENGLRSGNTHLHLMRLTHAEADRYLRVVPAADGLDLVFLSHLRRLPDERHYISNMIVENSLAGGELARLSQEGVLFRPGQEHRHNFGGYGEGYGHVMFLDIQKLIQPVSIGPGIMQTGTDGLPLQRGIKEARQDGATVVWCHNTFGFEDVPNWMAGLLDAQNIFDGGAHGSYQDTFYRYLNLGMRVPFSTGTDWFIYDFSRVYVPIEGELTSAKWLAQLATGRTYITNGPFLEFQVDGRQIGDTMQLDAPRELKIRARGIGRSDFRCIEVVANGTVVASAHARAAGGHFIAELDQSLNVDQPGWFAMRIPLHVPTNEFGKPLYAHTSPIYVELAGRRIFHQEIADELITEIERTIDVIQDKAICADDKEREAVLRVYREAVLLLRQRIAAHQ